MYGEIEQNGDTANHGPRIYLLHRLNPFVSPATGVSVLSRPPFSENSYKIQFWVYEIFMPGFEEISDQGFPEKYVKILKTFKTIFKI